jgi:hypothetical protein
VRARTVVVSGLAVLAVAGLALLIARQTPDPSSPTTTQWRQTAYIKASNPGEGDQFGSAVAVSADGRTLVIGAPMENSAAAGVGGDRSDESADDAGAVYVFVRSGSGWTEQAYIKASNAESFDQFGNAVALSADGNTLAVAAYFEGGSAAGDPGDNSRPQSGAAYVFTRTGTTWSQHAYLKASNAGEENDGDTFGYTIALSADGGTVAVGAPSEDSAAAGVGGDGADNSAAGAGAVYVFVRRADGWIQQAYLKPANTHAGMLFGYSVALSGDGARLAVGAFDERGCSTTINGAYEMNCGGTGAAYVFARSGDTWTQEAYLKAREQDRGDSMGVWTAISRDATLVAAGAADEDSTTTGVDVVESGHSGTVGAEDDRSSGASYVFARSGDAWSQQANFKASNTGTTDWFGQRVALGGGGDSLAVSAPNEDSSARGIGGRQDDDSADQAGAVYVFARAGGVWAQQAYVKASNTDAFDEFGGALALSEDGRTMAVGARFEDSGAAGAGGDQSDNSVMDAGAVYVFER